MTIIKQGQDEYKSDFSELGTVEERSDRSYELMHIMRMTALLFCEERGTKTKVIVDAAVIASAACKLIAVALAGHPDNISPEKGDEHRSRIANAMSKSISNGLKMLAEFEKEEPGYIAKALYSGAATESGRPIEVNRIIRASN